MDEAANSTNVEKLRKSLAELTTKKLYHSPEELRSGEQRIEKVALNNTEVPEAWKDERPTETDLEISQTDQSE